VKIEQERLGASERLSMSYARVLIPEAGGGYRAEILEFPGCIALGDDPAEAFSALEEAAEDWLEAAAEMGTPIPPPFEETDFSGKLGLRLPKSLHRKASLAAERDGVSLNQLIVASVAEYIGQNSAQMQQRQIVVLGGGAHSLQVVSNVGTSIPHMVTNFGGFETWVPPMQELEYADR
jgi:predicted RNase H-like HicB family nuclease